MLVLKQYHRTWFITTLWCLILTIFSKGAEFETPNIILGLDWLIIMSRRRDINSLFDLINLDWLEFHFYHYSDKTIQKHHYLKSFHCSTRKHLNQSSSRELFQLKILKQEIVNLQLTRGKVEYLEISNIVNCETRESEVILGEPQRSACRGNHRLVEQRMRLYKWQWTCR